MSEFTTPLDLRFNAEGKFALLDSFVYELSGLGTGVPIVVREGFSTDFASIPRLFRWWLSPTDPHYARAAVLHDWLYTQGIDRTIADAIFLEAMTVLGCPSIKRYAVYYGVRAGGWWAWHRYRAEQRGVRFKAFADTFIEVDEEQDSEIEKTVVLSREELPGG